MPRPKRNLRRKLVLSRTTVRQLTLGAGVSAGTGDCSCVGCSHHCAGGWMNQVAQ